LESFHCYIADLRRSLQGALDDAAQESLPHLPWWSMLEKHFRSSYGELERKIQYIIPRKL